MVSNINTKEYWENRFSSGDWEDKHGRWQTRSFAEGQIPHLEISPDFEGTILDFGCGLGDAIPVYKQNFPMAKLLGIDISQAAIDVCKVNYGAIASFYQCDHTKVTEVDIIIASNVLEHLTNDIEVAKSLLAKCKDLFVIVPYKEWHLDPEHVNTYTETYYAAIGNYTYKIFPCRGWSWYGFKLWYQIYFKNIFRFLLGRKIARRGMQIMFHFKGRFIA